MNPGFAITALISLALGIGATTAVFSVIRAVLMNPYPYVSADRIVFVSTQDKAGNENLPQVTGSQLQQLRNAKSADSVLALQGWELSTTGSNVPEDVRAVFFTPNASSFFGVPVLLGRGLIPSDAADGQDSQPVAVLSYSFWQRYFAGSADVVGKSLQLDHRNYTVVGVLPRRFAWWLADVYVPLKVTNNPAQPLAPYIRLKPGVSLQAADAEFQSLFEQFAKEMPARYPENFRVRTKRLIDEYGQSLRHALYLLFGAVLVLLFIGCANASILLLARGVLRQHELAVRTALGASRGRILRQLLTESLVLSLGVATLGVLLAYGAVALVVKWLPESLYPAEAAIQVNLPVLSFSIGLALLTGILFGLSPALRLSRPEVSQAMQSSTRKIAGGVFGKRTHSALIAVQIAMTLLLLTTAAASTQSFLRLMHTDLGYDPHNVLHVGIPIHDNAYMSWDARAAYFERLRQSVATIPGVVSASISSQSTPPTNGWTEKFEIMGGSSSKEHDVRLNLVSPEYFSILHIQLLRGRIWDQAETTRAARVAVINETMARQFWPNGDALGQAIRLPEMKSDPPLRFAAPGSDKWFEVAGVVADARNDGLANPTKPAIYLPYTAWLGVFPSILVRTISSPLSTVRAVRLRVSSVDPNQQIAGDPASLEESIPGQPEWQRGHLVTMLFGVFAVSALALAIIGLYSVVSYSVAQRTTEFGIRIALGAQPRNVLGLVFASTAISVGSGLAAGVLLSVAFSKLIAELAESSSRHPLIFLGVVLLVVCTSTLASFFPAQRASSIDPMEALRHQ
jgi:putative ABC transport system permease protein